MRRRATPARTGVMEAVASEPFSFNPFDEATRRMRIQDQNGPADRAGREEPDRA